MAVHDPAQRPPREMPKFLNQIMSLLLRSPLHKMMSSQIMLLSFRGRKTGKLYTTPVGYVRDGQQITLFTDHQWWKNLRNNAPVTVLIQGHTFQGTADAILDKAVTAQELDRYLRRMPNAARAFAVDKTAEGEPDQESVRQAAQRLTMVRLQLN